MKSYAFVYILDSSDLSLSMMLKVKQTKLIPIVKKVSIKLGRASTANSDEGPWSVSLVVNRAKHRFA